MRSPIRNLPLYLCIFVGACLQQRGIDTTQLCTLTVEPPNVPADNSSVATVTLGLSNFTFPLDAYIELKSSNAAVVLVQPSAPDASGNYIAEVRSAVPGLVDILAYIHAGRRTILLASAHVTFNALQPILKTSMLTASPNVVSADGVNTSTLTIQARDAHGHPVVAAPIAILVSGSDNILAESTGVTDVTGNFMTTLASTRAETKVVTAMLAGIPLSAMVTFSGSAPSLITTALIATPTSLLDDGISTSTLTLTVHDAQGNALANEHVVFSTNAINAALSTTAGSTSDDGTLVTQIKSSTAQATSVKATFGSQSMSVPITFIPGVPSMATSTLAASPTTATANNQNVITLTATVMDATSNAIPNVAVTFSAVGAGSMLSATSTFTASNGQVSVTLKSSKDQIETASFTNALVWKAANVTFVAGPANTKHSTFVASPSAVPDNGTTPSSLTLTLKDVCDNSVNAQAVTFSTVASNPNLNPTSGTTDVNGQLTLQLSSTTAQSTSATALFDGQSMSADVTFLAGIPDPAHASEVYFPKVLVANGVSTSLLTMTLRDSTDNPVPNADITFTSSNPCDVLSPLTTLTDANGQGTTAVASTIAEVKAINISNQFVNAIATITFIPGPPAAPYSTFTASPKVATANGNSIANLKFAAADAFNNKIANANVTFTASGYGASIIKRVVATDSNGVAQGTMTSSYPGQPTVSGRIEPIALDAAVSFSASVCAGGAPYYPEVPVVATQAGPSFALAHDLNRDGISDIIIVNTGANSVSAAFGTGNGAFGISAVYGAGALPSAVAMTDVNQDGNSDLLTANAGSSYITIRLAAGDGTFLGPLNLSLGNVTSLAAFDMNGDGIGDLVSLTRSANSLSVSPITSSGAFVTPSVYLTDSEPSDVAVADLNGDGILDVAVSNANSVNLNLYTGKGNGQFSTIAAYPASSSNDSIAVGDLNGDSALDILVGSNSMARIDVLLGDGHGALGAAKATPLANSPNDIGVGDFNNDGLLDVVAVSGSASVVAFGRGNGFFQAPVYGVAGSSTAALVVADLDNDANLDILSLDSVAGHAIPLLGQGTGSFNIATPRDLGLGLSSGGIAFADFNGDGKQDLLAASHLGNNVGLALGRGDGTFNVPTVCNLVQSPQGIATGDFDHDGKMDMVVVNGNSLTEYLGRNDGTFNPNYSVSTSNCYASAPIVGNFNGDTYPDLALVCPSSSQIYVYTGSSTGNFSSAGSFANGLTSALQGYLATGDFTGDGFNDLAVTQISSATVMVFAGLGNGSFNTTAVQTLSFSVNLGALASGDVDGDGKIDVVLSQSNGFVTVLRNNFNSTTPLSTQPPVPSNVYQPSSIAIADVDGNGTADTAVGGAGSYCVIHNGGATVTYPTTQDTVGVAIADINGDGLGDIVTTSSFAYGISGAYYTPHIQSGCKQ